MTIRIVLCLVVSAFAVAVIAPSQAVPTSSCGASATFDQALADCSAGGASNVPAGDPAPAGPHHDYQFTPICGGLTTIACDGMPCLGANGATGHQFYVHVDGELTGTICRTPPTPATAAATITPAQVLHAMRSLRWPASRLVIQPPHGKTLVNFDTNFFTRDTDAVARRVHLLGQRITIEATPSRYHWHFGDGTARTSSDPGAAYPALTITHQYLRKGTYRPRLDTEYAGRYRVGNGPWRRIGGTVTVAGTPQRLRVVTASPVLAAPYGHG